MTALLTILLLDTIAVAVIFAAVARVVIIPAERWNQGYLSKVAWIAVAVWWIYNLHFIVLPIGAIAALWQAHVINRQKPTSSLDVPYADGEPDSTDTETADTQEHA